MNYLAHAYLSRTSPALLTGGLLGDFVKGPLDSRYAPDIRAGIALHRAIDHYTDRHPLVQTARAQVAPVRRRFAGILTDMYFDHFLARHWSHYHDQPLERFTQSVYDVLWPQRHALPARLQRILPWMRADDWLASYAELDAIDAALRGMARRFRFASRALPLAEGVQDLVAHYTVFEQQFHAFFPQLERHVAQLHGNTDDPARTARNR